MQKLQLVFCLLMFILTTARLAKGNGNRQSTIRSIATFVLYVFSGALIGAGLGWLFRGSDGWGVGAFSCGFVGCFGALTATLYRWTNRADWSPTLPGHRPVTKITVVAVPAGGLLGTTAGWLIPGVTGTEGLILPFATMLLGILAGAVIAAVSEAWYDQRVSGSQDPHVQSVEDSSGIVDRISPSPRSV